MMCSLPLKSLGVLGYMLLLGYVLFIALMPPGFAGVPYSVLTVLLFLCLSPLSCVAVRSWSAHAAAVLMFWAIVLAFGGFSLSPESAIAGAIALVHASTHIACAKRMQAKPVEHASGG